MSRLAKISGAGLIMAGRFHNKPTPGVRWPWKLVAEGSIPSGPNHFCLCCAGKQPAAVYWRKRDERFCRTGRTQIFIPAATKQQP